MTLGSEQEWGLTVTDLVIAEGIFINSTDEQLVLTWANIEAEGLIKGGVETLGIFGALLVCFLEPHLDKGIRLANEILVGEVGGPVQPDVELTLLGGLDSNGSVSCNESSEGSEKCGDGEELHG